MSPKLERIPSLYLADMVDSLSGLGKFPPSFIGLFWTILSSKGQEAYLPYLTLKDGRDIQLNGLAYFKNDKMVGKTTPIEIGIYMSVRGIHKGGYGAFVKVPGTNKLAVWRTISRKTRIKVNFKSGRPHVQIDIKYEGEIGEKENPQISIADSSVIKKIEKEANKDVMKSTRKFIIKTQKAKSDIFGFGEYFRANYPRFWNQKIKSKDKWEDYYQNLTYDINVDTHIHRTGMKAK